jgi:predicted nucleic acid-binding protein
MKVRNAYFDTSVIVKNYLKETGSQRARQLFRTRQVITSAIAGLESISAFKRTLASGAIDEKAYTAVVRQFQKHREKFKRVELTAEILETAEKYIVGFNVRALDAIHLASAVRIDPRFPKRLPFVTADSVQRNAALQLGLEVVWID